MSRHDYFTQNNFDTRAGPNVYRARVPSDLDMPLALAAGSLPGKTPGLTDLCQQRAV